MRYIFVVFTAFSLLIAQNIKAGPWNLQKGKGYSQFSFTYLNYGNLLNGGDEKIELNRNIGDYTFQIYTEYGLSNKLNLIVNLPYKIVSASNELNNATNAFEDTLSPGELAGFSNFNIGLRYNLIAKSYVLSAQLDIYNKTHTYDDVTGLQIGYDSYLFYPSLLYGKGWNNGYIQAQGGVMLNTANYAQNALGNVEIGKKLWEGKSYLILRTDVKIPLTTGHYDERNSIQTGLYRDNSSFISPGLKWIQSFKSNFYLNLAIYGAVYSKNEGAQATFNIGLAKTW